MKSLVEMLVKKRKPPRDSSALALLECLGEVEIGRVVFTDKVECRVTLGSWGDVRLCFWGTGEDITAAAQDTVAKMNAAGVLDELRQSL